MLLALQEHLGLTLQNQVIPSPLQFRRISPKSHKFSARWKLKYRDNLVFVNGFCTLHYVTSVCREKTSIFSQQFNQQMHFIEHNSLKVTHSYMFWHLDAILWEISKTKEYKFDIQVTVHRDKFL